MGWAYGRAWHCSARRPEDDPPNAPITRPRNCQEDAWIIQRQASNLHIPELRMLLSIPRRHTSLHNILGLQPIRDNLYGAVPGSVDDLRRVLENFARRRIPLQR
ncbi:MAG: hypothetical protein WCF03_01715 [Nitrososphaeraceae archaeon]